jgi:predicted alpha-1,2-mannosidase
MRFNYDRPGAPGNREPVDYVDTNIGTLSYKTWSTSPTVQLPHGMMEVDPYTTPGIGDKYLADKIHGFMAGAFVAMPTLGSVRLAPAENASAFDHDFELATPYCYAVLLEDSEIEAAITASERAAYFRFAFPDEATGNVVFYLAGDAEAAFQGGKSLAGSHTFWRVKTYFYLEFDQAPVASAVVKLDAGDAIGRGRRRLTPTLVASASFDTAGGREVHFRAGISYISVEQARENLNREIPDWDFEGTKGQARDRWNQMLSRIKIDGGTEDQKAIFYTAIYRDMQRMKNITEGGKYFSGFDGQVHDTGEVGPAADFYNVDQPWDTYRCARPLQMLLEPEHINDMLQSYARMAQQLGWMPMTPHVGGEHASMIGRHIVAIIADGYAKGFRGFDLKAAYAGMRVSALERTILPWIKGPATELDRAYDEQGYIPALPTRPDQQVDDPDEWRANVRRIVTSELPQQITWLPEVGVDEWVPEVDRWHRRQSVSVTLENAYDDWCLAQLAEALGKADDAAHFMRRAASYRNLFNPSIGFMAPKAADGTWVEPFHPTLSGGFAGEGYYAEMNAWTYTFHVQHDVQGLIDLMGGREAFVDKLDALFTEQYIMDKPAFWGQFPDMSGLIGQYAHGNEPCFHVPYLYNYAGTPWKTQRRVRDIMKIWYNAGPMGLCGDDDIGSLSSWYVFSAMGFYPVSPGRPVYDLGSPLFETVTISLAEGKAFTIRAKDVSDRNKYIQSATLNGVPLNRPWLWHHEITDGGTLELVMGSRPNKAWGSAPEVAPPSMSQG